MVQTGQTAAWNCQHDIAERLARWLLMCHDRREEDTFTTAQSAMSLTGWEFRSPHNSQTATVRTFTAGSEYGPVVPFPE